MDPSGRANPIVKKGQFVHRHDALEPPNSQSSQIPAEPTGSQLDCNRAENQFLRYVVYAVLQDRQPRPTHRRRFTSHTAGITYARQTPAARAPPNSHNSCHAATDGHETACNKKICRERPPCRSGRTPQSTLEFTLQRAASEQAEA